MKRIDKALITRKLNSYLKKGSKILSLNFRAYNILLVPGSNKIIFKTTDFKEPLSAKRISDYFVENGCFLEFYQLVRDSVRV
jgi:hypothetical protein